MVSRRSFLGALALAPVAAPSVSSFAKGVPEGRRVSTIPGDLGERLFAECRGDGRIINVFLDGVEQMDVITADEALGMIRRTVRSEAGNMAIDAKGNLLLEDVYGNVRLDISEPLRETPGCRQFSGHKGAEAEIVEHPSRVSGRARQLREFDSLAADYERVWQELDDILPV